MIEFVIYETHGEKSLNIVTFDGSNQPYHPSVIRIDCKNFKYKYYMGQTPYPIGSKPYRDRWECPSIYASSDGIVWKNPEGLINPIDDLNCKDIEIKNYFSDPHLVYNEINKNIECWYRYGRKEGEKYRVNLFRKTTIDGVTWSDRELIYDNTIEEDLVRYGEYFLSPAIIIENRGYSVWYVDGGNIHDKEHTIKKATISFDGKWKTTCICELKGAFTNPWHIDIQKFEGEYYLTIYDYQKDNVVLYKSLDGILFDFEKIVIQKKMGSYYWNGLYRTCLLFDDNKIRVYFSCDDGLKTRIGYMEGRDINSLKVVDIEDGYAKQKYLEYIKMKYISSLYHVVKLNLYNIYRKIFFRHKK